MINLVTLKIIFMSLLLVLMISVLPFVYAAIDSQDQVTEDFVSTGKAVTEALARLNDLELVTGVQANTTSHENRLLSIEKEAAEFETRITQNESDILFLLTWYNNITDALNELLSYDLYMMREDINTNATMINTHTVDILALQVVSSYLNPTDICNDGRDNDLDGLIDEYDGLFMPFTDFGNCSLVGLEDELEGTDIHGSIFEDTDLNGVTFRNVDIHDTDFNGALNTRIYFEELSNVVNCGFVETSLITVSFRDSDGSGCDFSNSNLSGYINYLYGATGNFVNISGVSATGIEIYDSAVTNIIGNNMTLVNHFQVDGSDLSNSDLSNLDTLALNIMNTNLSNSNLSNIVIVSQIYMIDSNLSNSILIDAEMTDTNGGSFTNVDFTNSILTNAIFTDSVIIDTSFINATLDGADFTNVEFTDVDFTEASIINTIFTGCTGNPICPS